MQVNVINVEVDIHSLIPALTIGMEIIYYDKLEAPISISGRMSTADGKKVSFLNEFHINSEKSFNLGLLSKTSKEDIFRSGNKHQNKSYVILTTVLLPKAIEHIEDLREKDHEKAVRLHFEFVLKNLEIHAEPHPRFGITNITPFIGVQATCPNATFIIKQSDWINGYSPKLGLGNFLLLELQIPNQKFVDNFWLELYSKIGNNLKEMESAIRSGDWSKAMFYARKYYENIKIGDGKPGHKEFENKLRLLFLKDQHSEEGFKNFLDAIWQFFEFTSKFIHEKDKKGQITPVPIPTKEDAYFAYALGVGLLNIIGKKTSSD